MFLSIPSAFRSKHSGSSSSLYAFRWTNVVVAPGVAFSTSSALRTYGVTFLLYPMYTGTPFSAAYAFISSSSATVGAPGFSRYTCVQPASITSLSSFGLSAVRPEMSARVGPCAAVRRISCESVRAGPVGSRAPGRARAGRRAEGGGAH